MKSHFQLFNESDYNESDSTNLLMTVETVEEITQLA